MTLRYNTITYLVGEGFKNILKNKKSTSASLVIMCLTMLIFGVFFIIGENINSVMKQVEGEQGIEVFLNDISEEKTKEVGDYIRNIEGVSTVKYKTKEQALNQLKSQFGENAYLLSGYDEENIFPASYIVMLDDLTKSSEIQTIINDIDKNVENEEDKVISDIASSDQTIATLVSLANGIKLVTGIILIFLILISVFIIANTIKLTVHARRKEISIMKYVGATNSFIRWPFIVEGIILGIISGAISLLIVGGAYNVIIQKILDSTVMIAMNLSLVSFSEMFTLIAAVYLLLGTGMGILGSSISMRRYLKV